MTESYRERADMKFDAVSANWKQRLTRYYLHDVYLIKKLRSSTNVGSRAELTKTRRTVGKSGMDEEAFVKNILRRIFSVNFVNTEIFLDNS